MKTGDIVVRLDETHDARQPRHRHQERSTSWRRARRGSRPSATAQDKLDLPGRAPRARRNEPDVAQVIAERAAGCSSCAARRAQGQKAQLHERIDQLREQILGLDEQVAAKAKEIDWIQQELERRPRPVEARTWCRSPALTTLERDAARLHGERGALIAVDRPGQGPHRRDPAPDPADRPGSAHRGRQGAGARSAARRSELIEKRVAAEDQLKRIDIRAPQDGMVHQLAVHTVGGVIRPAKRSC